MKKLGIFISHPIQYQVPLYKKLSKKIDLTVYYYSQFGAEKYFDPQFKKEIKWDINLLEVYNYKFLKNYSSKPGFHFFGFINFGIFKEIFKNKFDAVLINSWSYLSDWLVILACLILKTKLLLRVESPYNQEILKPKWKLFIKKIIFGKILFPKIYAFLYIGEENRKFYKFYGVPDEKLFFAPYAVDNERFQKEYERLKEKKEELRKELGIEPDDVVILFVGKLIPKKRPMDLIKAYETITTIRMIRMCANTANENANNNHNPNNEEINGYSEYDVNNKIIEKELSYKLNGIFFKIHNILGRFAKEKQYADALENELKKANIKYRREVFLDVFGKKSNIPDFIIEDKILVEIKRKPINTKEDYQQVKRYLESTNIKLGILVNFGLEYLKPKRILNSKFKIDKDNSYHHSLNSHYGIHLIFVGDGDLRQELEKYAETVINNINHNANNANLHEYSEYILNKNHSHHHSLNSHSFVDSHYGIHFVGFKNQTEISKYYAMSDIFVLPSDVGETWGLVVNEAMNFRLPVIVSDLVGCGSDLVKHGENGYIFKTGNIEELAKYLEELINHNANNANMREYSEYAANNENSHYKNHSHCHSLNSHPFVDSHYGLKKRRQFGEKSFEIVKGYNYDKTVESILEVILKIK
jgi:GxxExxY protein